MIDVDRETETDRQMLAAPYTYLTNAVPERTLQTPFHPEFILSGASITKSGLV